MALVAALEAFEASARARANSLAPEDLQAAVGSGCGQKQPLALISPGPLGPAAMPKGPPGWAVTGLNLKAGGGPPPPQPNVTEALPPSLGGRPQTATPPTARPAPGPRPPPSSSLALFNRGGPQAGPSLSLRVPAGPFDCAVLVKRMELPFHAPRQVEASVAPRAARAATPDTRPAANTTPLTTTEGCSNITVAAAGGTAVTGVHGATQHPGPTATATGVTVTAPPRSPGSHGLPRRVDRKRSRVCADLDCHETALLDAVVRAAPACLSAGFSQREMCVWLAETVAAGLHSVSPWRSEPDTTGTTAGPAH